MWRQFTLLRHRWLWYMRGRWRRQLRRKTRSPHIILCDPFCTHYIEWRNADVFNLTSHTLYYIILYYIILYYIILYYIIIIVIIDGV